GNEAEGGWVRGSGSYNPANGVTGGEENWEFIGANGERLETHVKYERGAARRNPTAEVKFFNPSNPGAYQIFKVDSGLDIMKNASVPIKDRVKEFTYKATGGNIGALFDGTEKALSWDSFHWYNRGIYNPWSRVAESPDAAEVTRREACRDFANAVATGKGVTAWPLRRAANCTQAACSSGRNAHPTKRRKLCVPILPICSRARHCWLSRRRWRLTSRPIASSTPTASRRTG